MEQSRWKSKYLWAAILAVIFFVLGHYGLYSVIGIDEAGLTKFFDLIWIALAGMGIVNNPTDKENW